MLRNIYHSLKRSPAGSRILQACDFIVSRRLPEHGYPLSVRLVSNHWVRSSYEKEIRDVFRVICKTYSLKSLYDVGSNIGIFALDFLSINDRNSVCAFEPNPFVFACLKRTKEKNQIASLHIFDVALSDRSGISKLTFDPLSPAKGGLHPIRDGKYNHELEYGGISVSLDVKTETLDALCTTIGQDAPDILKIDAEGEELSILKGAEQLCRTYQPILFFECSKNAEEIRALLVSYGYAFRNVKLEPISELAEFNIALPVSLDVTFPVRLPTIP